MVSKANQFLPKFVPPAIPTPSSFDKLIPFGITSITNGVPVKLNFEKLNYNSWSSFFKIHLGSFGLNKL